MAKSKGIKGIFLYFSFEEPLNALTDEQRGRLVSALLEYGKYEKIPNFSGELQMLFMCIKQGIDENKCAYNEKCEKNRANIKKRWDEEQKIIVQNDTSVYGGNQEIPPYTNDTNKIKLNKNINKNINKNLKDTYAHFDALWAAYPKKKGKENAKKAFVKLSPNDTLFVQMLKALEAQKRSDDWNRDEGRYIPYPATWINNRRWEDEETANLRVYADGEEDVLPY